VAVAILNLPPPRRLEEAIKPFHMNWYVNRDNPLPLYEQVKHVLREKILIEEFPVGTLLPSEQELCARFKVSRITVRRALNDLERAGLVRSIQGKGTYVERKRVHNNLDVVSGFTRSTRMQSLNSSSTLLSSEPREADNSLQQAFSLLPDSGERFRDFRRLLQIDGRPVALLTATVREELGDKLLTYDLNNASFYSLYREITGHRVVRSLGYLTPIISTQEVAALLEVEPGTPQMHFRGISYLPGDIPVEMSSGIYRGDTFQWRFSMHEDQLDAVSHIAPQFDLFTTT
jgi:GntR family transcriptional regulator